MTPLVECVPNFSEGRDATTIDALENAVRSVEGAHLLDRHADTSHNRCVLTLAGQPDAIGEAAFQAAVVATQRIDLRSHRGVHPRMGATDVVPFVPLQSTTMESCIELANELGARIGGKLGIPVYLYGAAARQAGRVHLPDVRRPQFEGLADRIGVDPAWQPDFGPDRVHPTAGATAVGVRAVLVAFNIFLDSDDLRVAQAIARSIRASSGGLPSVQARGFLVDGRAQVSMNLLDVAITSPAAVFEAVLRRAAEAGRDVVRSEIVGLIPQRALPRDAERALRLDGSVEDHILERRLESATGRDR